MLGDVWEGQKGEWDRDSSARLQHLNAKKWHSSNESSAHLASEGVTHFACDGHESTGPQILFGGDKQTLKG